MDVFASFQYFKELLQLSAVAAIFVVRPFCSWSENNLNNDTKVRMLIKNPNKK